MNENFEKKFTPEQLREQAVVEYLQNLKEKHPIEIDNIVSVTSGEFKFKGLKVVGIEEGKIKILPTPESVDEIEFDESEVFHLSDIKKGFEASFKDWPQGMLN